MSLKNVFHTTTSQRASFKYTAFYGGGVCNAKGVRATRKNLKSLVSAIDGDKVSSSIKLPGSMAE